ncbi:MAG: hypothetical protein ACFFA0_09920 [Promethearchaeota archaeon]
MMSSSVNLFGKFDLELSKYDIVIFDIDGVVNKTLPWKLEKKLTRDEWKLLKTHTDCTDIFKKTIKIIKQIKIPFAFITGRRPEHNLITEEMFQRAGLKFIKNKKKKKFIYYYRDKWEVEEYVNFKKDTIKDFLQFYKDVVYFDDSEEVVKHLKKMISSSQFKVFHYHAGYMDNLDIFPQLREKISLLMENIDVKNK